MPNYRFECKRCNRDYYELTMWDSTGKYSYVECPKCGSKEKEQLATSCSFQFAQPEGTDRWNSEASGHDYRFWTKRDDTRDERENAEKKSHMGGSDDIYRKFDDLNKGDPFNIDKV